MIDYDILSGGLLTYRCLKYGVSSWLEHRKIRVAERLASIEELKLALVEQRFMPALA